MKHYREIDILRGIAIIMVFLGHAVIVYPINLENVAWCRGLVAFISAVHMPLFFIVAGFCFHRKSTYVDMVQKKIKRLLVPYVIFNLFDMCCRLVLSKFVNRPCGIRESMIKMLFYGGEYWFLYVLFLMCILWGGILPYVKKHVWLQVIVGIAAVVLNVLQISFDVCKVDSLCRFFVFFYAGFLIQIHFDHLTYMKKVIKNMAVLLAGTIFWGGIFVLWYRNGWNFIPEFLISFVGIFVCLVFAAKICNTKLGLCLADVGKYSLQLYLLDGYFLGASRMVLVQLLACTSPVVIVVGNTVLDLMGAFWVIRYVLMKVKGLRILCGER